MTDTKDDLIERAEAAISHYDKTFEYETGDLIQFLLDRIAGQQALNQAAAKYEQFGGDEEKDPLERLRFFCSLAMPGQAWIDSERFFDEVSELIAGQQAMLAKKDEALKQVCEMISEHCDERGLPEYKHPALALTSPTDALSQAILKEREACAKKAERMVNGKAIAAAIRARGEKK